MTFHVSWCGSHASMTLSCLVVRFSFYFDLSVIVCFLTCDLNFLNNILGLNGCSSTFACIYCKVLRAPQHSKSSERYETVGPHTLDHMEPRTLAVQIQLAHTPSGQSTDQHNSLDAMPMRVAHLTSVRDATNPSDLATRSSTGSPYHGRPNPGVTTTASHRGPKSTISILASCFVPCIIFRSCTTFSTFCTAGCAPFLRFSSGRCIRTSMLSNWRR
jgi:hypothetical protein